MHGYCNGVSCFQQIFEKKLRIYFWSLAIFTFLWVLLLAPSWQHLGCQFLSVKSSGTILLIDRSEQDSKIKSYRGANRENFKKQ